MIRHFEFMHITYTQFEKPFGGQCHLVIVALTANASADITTTKNDTFPHLLREEREKGKVSLKILNSQI